MKPAVRYKPMANRAEDVRKDEIDGLEKNENALLRQKAFSVPKFPLTANMFFISLLFWLCLCSLVYFSIRYGLMIARITDEADINGKCSDEFGKTEAENFKRVEKYAVGEAAPYLQHLQILALHNYPQESTILPPLVTGITSAQFVQFQGLVRHVLEDIKNSEPDLKLIVYDLGLRQTERRMLKQYCQCEVRTFNFQQFPDHVSSIYNKAWRPIIIQLLLKEYESVMYVEPTTRFKRPTSPDYLRRRGTKNYLVWDATEHQSLLAFTDRGMFEYLNESRCAFRDCSLLTPEAIVVYRTERSWTEFMRPWLVCAFNEKCIAPKYAQFSGCIETRQPKTTGCHRFDMSALSIILNRGAQYTVYANGQMSFRFTYTDLAEVAYFPDSYWTYRQLLAFMFAPAIILAAYTCVFKKRRFPLCMCFRKYLYLLYCRKVSS